MKKRKKPRFHRQGSHFYKRIMGKGWRRPRGEDSLQRRNIKSRGARPTTGYGQPRAIRGLHPCGLQDVLIFNENQVARYDPKKHCLRIGSGVGGKKRTAIIKKAGERGFKILNKKVQ